MANEIHVIIVYLLNLFLNLTKRCRYDLPVGATAVYILESAVTKGLKFNSVWSVGNAKQIGAEDILQYMDEILIRKKILKLNYCI